MRRVWRRCSPSYSVLGDYVDLHRVTFGSAAHPGRDADMCGSSMITAPTRYLCSLPITGVYVSCLLPSQVSGVVNYDIVLLSVGGGSRRSTAYSSCVVFVDDSWFLRSIS